MAESSSGSIRSAPTAVLRAAALHALPAPADPAFGAWLTSALDWRRGQRSPPLFAAGIGDGQMPEPGRADPSLEWATAELLRRDEEVRQGLADLEAGCRPSRVWHAPLYRCHRVAAEAGARSTVHFGLASALLVLGGWPAADGSLALVAVIIGLGATAPSPLRFTTGALIGAPLAVVLTGVLEFLILNGVTEFPLLALALAPFMIGSTVLMTLPNMTLSALGRFNLIFILVILGPSNPQTYDPQAFLFTALFLVLAVTSLFAFQILIPPVSEEHSRRSLIASARRDFRHVLSRSDRRYSPGESKFRDATRIGQLVVAGGSAPQHRAVLTEAVSYFDQAAMIRLSAAKLASFDGTPLGAAAAQARSALVQRDPRLVRQAAANLMNAASPVDSLVRTTSGALILVANVLESGPQHASRTEGIPARGGSPEWRGARHADPMECET